MKFTLKLPKLAQSMQTGSITEWLVSEGDTVQQGQPLYVIEAEKSATEIECPFDGTIRDLCATHEELAVGTPIAIVEN